MTTITDITLSVAASEHDDTSTIVNTRRFMRRVLRQLKASEALVQALDRHKPLVGTHSRGELLAKWSVDACLVKARKELNTGAKRDRHER